MHSQSIIGRAERMLAPVLALILSGCVCENRPFQEFPSPDGKVFATLFEANCGATIAFTTVVSLRYGGTVTNPNAESIVFEGPGQLPLGISWEGPRLLVIRSRESEPRLIRDKWRDVTIRLHANSVVSMRQFICEQHWVNWSSESRCSEVGTFHLTGESSRLAGGQGSFGESTWAQESRQG